MKRSLLIISLIILILTGCSAKTETLPDAVNPAADESSETAPASHVASEIDSSYTATPAMTVVEKEYPPENFKDTISAGNSIISENTVISDISVASENTAASENNAETSPENDDGSADENKAGIFTSSELTDVIKQRITGLSYAEGCTIPYEDLRYLQLSYVDFNGRTQLGEMICNKAVASDLLDIFSELFHNGYQIEKIRLIDDYNADDDLSCADNNTSCFNFRVVAGSTNLSKHAQGVAVDINPFYNPYVTYPDGKIRISPVGSEAYADRSSDFPHKIDENDLAYKLFTEHGFTWGGHWKTLKDYQHFQKPLD